MSAHLSKVTSIALMEPWLIQEQWLDVIEGILESHLAGKEPPKIERKESDAPWTQAGVDFIPVNGVIAPKMGLLDNLSGGTSVEALRDAFADAINNESSATICFLFNSPGGNAQGGFEFADEISLMRSRTAKPVLAHIEGRCCSLAYLFASQCDQITMTVGSEAGSIGAFSKLTSRERQMKNEGVESIVIRSSPLKGIGADGVTGEQLAHLQARINAMNAMFQSYVTRERSVDFSARDMAAVFPAMSFETLPSAVDIGLVDGISTREQILTTYGSRS